MGVNNNIYLGVGNISHDFKLGSYYQDFTQAIYHFDNNSLGRFDDQGIPYLKEPNRTYYSISYVIQYALILHDIHLNGNKDYKSTILSCLEWLENKAEPMKDSLVWRSDFNQQYGLKKGWVSAMYQGQAVSLFLRAYQMFEKDKYLDIAKKAFAHFQYDYEDGGTKRVDENGYIWYEEYPTSTPSYVLNGFIYSMFGILDFYRATKDVKAKELFDSCINTLEGNLHKYDVWYWSIYDQLKKQLVSYYYQKNVHVPLMEILFELTQKDIFQKYAIKWKRNLNSKLSQVIVQLMYRVQPKIKKLRG